MRDPQASTARRLEAAKAAAPFLHPRLNSIDHKVTGEAGAETAAIQVTFVRPPKYEDDE